MMHLPLAIHILAAVIWVGGMFFAHMVLRPATESLPLPERLGVWNRVLAGFFRWVWGAVFSLPMSGYWIVNSVFGGMDSMPNYVHIMHGIAWVMIILYLYVFFGPYKKMQGMLKELLYPEAGLYMLKIRSIVTINLILGLIVCVIAVTGRYWT